MVHMIFIQRAVRFLFSIPQAFFQRLIRQAYDVKHFSYNEKKKEIGYIFASEKNK